MANKLIRKKPGYTKSGQIKIVSLSYKELHELVSKTSKKKVEAKIRRRMQTLERRPGFVNPIKEVVEEVKQETQPV
jgi:putative component of toxin-antitoxin plasmid stabilization module